MGEFTMQRIIDYVVKEEQDVQDIMVLDWSEEEITDRSGDERANVAKGSRELLASIQQRPRAFEATA
jgi:hypothetical protein